MQLNGFYIGREQGEGPFHAYSVGDLPDGKGSRMARTLALDHISLEALDTLFITFQDLIIDSDVSPALNFGKSIFPVNCSCTNAIAASITSFFKGWQSYVFILNL